MKEAVEFFQ